MISDATSAAILIEFVVSSFESTRLRFRSIRPLPGTIDTSRFAATPVPLRFTAGSLIDVCLWL